MAKLKSVAELAFRKVFPKRGDESSNLFAEFVATAKLFYAGELWNLNRANKNNGDGDIVPSNLLVENELIFENGYASYQHISPLFSLNKNSWISVLGNPSCSCDETYYVINNNEYLLYCNDASRSKKIAIVMQGKIKFPEGVYNEKIPITYVTTGEDLEDDIEIDDAIGRVVFMQLVDTYQKKEQTDKTNNSNPNI